MTKSLTRRSNTHTCTQSVVHWDFAGGIAKSDHTKKTRKIPPMCPLELREATRRVWCFSFGTSRLILVHQPRAVFKMYHPSSFLWLLVTSSSCAARSSRKNTQPPKHSYDERMKRGRPIRTALSGFCVTPVSPCFVVSHGVLFTGHQAAQEPSRIFKKKIRSLMCVLPNDHAYEPQNNERS